jgi:hypothetical protein
MDHQAQPTRAGSPQVEKSVSNERRIRFDGAHAPIPRPITVFSTPGARGSN